MPRATGPIRRVAAAAICPMAMVPHADARMPDTFLARVEALASMETLNADILAGRSATKVLERWCAVHGMAPEPKVRAELVRGVEKPLDNADRARLAIEPNEPIKHRHVRLICGGHVLSEADNWYVPGRLTDEMNRLLETTDTPFGKAVAALNFTRETFAADSVWMPLPEDWQIRPHPADHPGEDLKIPPVLFQHKAVLYDAQHRPFALVDEHYTRDLLEFGAPR